MRRISAWAMSTLTVLVLLFSYNTSRSSSLPEVTAVSRSATSTSEQGATAASGGASSSRVGSGSAATQVYAGDEVMTRYGVVQVRITVEAGRIASAEALQFPSTDRHDQMINSRAVPIYNAEAVEAQSADIDVVSGATVTWEGYTESLQAAIDRAHL